MCVRRTAVALIFAVISAADVASAQTFRVPGDFANIQAALNAVTAGSIPDGSVIEVQPGTYAEALLINTTSRSVTVRGVAGPASTVVNASGSGQSALRILRATGAIRVEGLTFRGGTGVAGTGGGFTFEDASPVLLNVIVEGNTGLDSGGGVLTRSNAQFSDCIIRNNTAARFGGGVTITTGSRPVFSNCQIRDNASGTGGPGLGNIGSGGGVHVNDASPTFRGCLITGNQSKFAAGGIFHLGVFGSANGPAVLVLEDTEVSNNTASRFSAGDNPAEGGGIHVEDNAVGYLIRAKILNNTANTSGGLSAYRARFEISSSRIEGNHAQDAQGIGGFGGGIGISSNNVSTPLRQAGSLVLTDSVVRGNDARAGAGIFASGDQTCGSPTPSCTAASATHTSVQVLDSLIDGNAAGLSGGGIRADRANLAITNSHILNNTVAAAAGQSYGGGLLLALESQGTIIGTTIAGNASVNLGGGLFIDGAAVLSMSGSRVYHNTSASGGGLYIGNNGPPSGTVSASIIADNTTYQIHEQACAPLVRTILTYQNNTLTPRSGQTDLYVSTCGGSTTTISGFNALPSGRASGNNSNTPSFASFLATPDVGPAVLSWSVSRASNVTIDGSSIFPGDTKSIEVAPSSPHTYALTSSGGPSGVSTASVDAPRFWGASLDTPLNADFDGDGKTDFAVYRPGTGQWFIARSSAGFLQQSWGAPSLGDVAIPADYDGDGKADIAVFRQATGQWIILNSGSGTVSVVGWGAPALGDTPVPADYDGDGKADIAVYRKSTGDWFIRLSMGGSWQAAWGAPSLGDVPVPADYDGDGKADVAVYRGANGTWFISRSSGGSTTINWGAPTLGDTPVPADYDGDGKADIAVARAQTGEWFVRRSLGGSIVTTWGLGASRVPGDFDGVGRAQIAIWQAASGTWIIRP